MPSLSFVNEHERHAGRCPIVTTSGNQCLHKPSCPYDENTMICRRHYNIHISNPTQHNTSVNGDIDVMIRELTR